MEKKYMVIVIITVIAIATTLTMAVTAFAQSNGVPSISKNCNISVTWIPFRNRMPKLGRGFGPWIKGFEVVVSEEFKQKVINILESDPDTASLLRQGYNVTQVKPIITMVVEGDGSVTLRAKKAVAILCKNGEGRAVVYVDVEVGKVLAVYKFETIVKETTTSTTSSKLSLRC